MTKREHQKADYEAEARHRARVAAWWPDGLDLTVFASAPKIDGRRFVLNRDENPPGYDALRFENMAFTEAWLARQEAHGRGSWLWLIWLALLALALVLLGFCPPAEAAGRRVRVRHGWHAARITAAPTVQRAVPIQRVAAQDSGPDSTLIDAGRRWGVLSLRTGQQHPELQAAAEAHAAYQARVGVQGHQSFDRRYQQLRHVGGNVREVANESWPGQDEAAAANEMYNSWRQSSGHWSAVNGRCRFWGYSMRFRPQNRTWYACGLFAD